jgi:hypothetical protein
MKILRYALIALLSVAILATGAAKAASTTNYSDQWWKADESGWGAAVLQQADVLFIDLFVYGTDGKPTWFVASVYLQSGAAAGHDVFTGDLYATTGPYFGNAFNSAPVVARKVGTMTFDASSGTTATMVYTVDGTRVEKPVTRQPLRNENIGGSFIGGWVLEQTACTPASDNGRDEVDGIISIIHPASNVVTIALQSRDGEDNCTITGTYSQNGHLGQIANGALNCASIGGTLTGTLNVFEIERSISGLTARFNGRTGSGSEGCTIANGRLGGVRR